jgi:hypothetical protein
MGSVSTGRGWLDEKASSRLHRVLKVVGAQQQQALLLFTALDAKVILLVWQSYLGVQGIAKIYHVGSKKSAGASCAAYSHQGSPNRWEPVRFDRLPVKPVRPGSGLVRYPTGQNSKFKFKFKKWKIPKKFLKILQGAMNLIVSNFLKNSFI